MIYNSENYFVYNTQLFFIKKVDNFVIKLFTFKQYLLFYKLFIYKLINT